MTLPVALELGSKRTFASALDWPGWSRSGRDEATALQALLDYAPRYAGVIRPARLGFNAGVEPAQLTVAERLKGGTTTDFGAPGAIPKADFAPVDEADRKRLEAILKACWRFFDRTMEAARGKQLAVGPRGGGRLLEQIARHVHEAEHAYITATGWILEEGSKRPATLPPEEQRHMALLSLRASAAGELPERGPRGGLRWPARYFVRRSAWHILDHAWEVEDRLP